MREKRSKPIHIPEDPIEFFTKILHITPYPHQARFLQDPSPLKVLRWCRRAGKTTVMSGDDLRFAATHPNARIIVTMPKWQQVKEIYFQGGGGLHEHLARMDEDVYERLIYAELQTIIRFRNKAVILAETPEPFTIRGHGPQKISIDEMNFIRKDRDLWLSALLPMTLTRTVYINVASTPWNRDSIYHAMCFDKNFRIFSGNKFEHDPPRYLRTWKDVLKPHGPLDPKQVEIMREQYAGDPWRWKREMECAFVDDETAFLPSSLIIKCQNEELDFAKFEDIITGNFYVGWDLGRERDHGVVSVVDKREDVCCLVHCKQFPPGTPYVTQMAYIKSICDRWKTVHAVYYHHTGTKGIDEEIGRAGFPGLVGVDFTRPTKHGIAMVLKQLMMSPRKSDAHLLPKDARRRFELPFDQDVQAELNIVQWEQSPGSEVYTFSHPAGSHDDRFWAIGLSVYAATKAQWQGTLQRAY
ncbi:MAG: terminase large subunit domain-containing protein [bacterium]